MDEAHKTLRVSSEGALDQQGSSGSYCTFSRMIWGPTQKWVDDLENITQTATRSSVGEGGRTKFNTKALICDNLIQVQAKELRRGNNAALGVFRWRG